MSNILQDTIQALLHKFVAEGNERGVQVTAYIEGKLAVDAWAGVSDVRTGAVVDGDTLFPVFSTTKGIFATVIHILAERGLIDYDTPIAKYWPAFGANGKEAITPRHALAHTSGIPFMPEGITLEQMWDWDFMAAAMEGLTPHWPSGMKQHYHSLTYGWILGELARRVDGRSVPQLLEEEICRPLGLTRLYCGIPAELEPETAFLEQFPEPEVVVPPPPHDIPPCAMPLYSWINRTGSRLSPQPGCSGIMSARAIARHYAAVLPGGVDGVELISPERLRVATAEQVPTGGYDEGSGLKALGYQFGTKSDDWGVSATAFGHGGHGGSHGYADTKYRLAVGITRNRFSDHCLGPRIIQEIRQSLGAPVPKA
jgi:CubicO group peptidase (beta-lactamase class C family)